MAEDFVANTLYIMSLLHVLILSFVEGITEFLPISSTGHLILTSHWLGLEATDFQKAFDVIIQFGAIFAVVVLYKERFKINIEFYKKIIVGSLPALLVGFLVKNKIDALLESTTVVAWSLIIGGVIFIFVDQWVTPDPTKREVTLMDSLRIGFIQCLALIPGVSRSGSTIIGAQLQKYDRKTAAEFSFFLAVPTLTAATLYKCWKIRHIVQSDQLFALVLGTVLSFIFALIALRTFIRLVQKYGFKPFGYYRIALGAAVLFFTKGN